MTEKGSQICGPFFVDGISKENKDRTILLFLCFAHAYGGHGSVG